jgi:hypothetical protein
MSVIDWFKLFWKVRTPVEDTIKEIKTMKSGWKSSEFWIHLATQATVLWAAVQGFVPPKVAAIVTVSGSAIYTIARTVLKAIQDVKAVQTPPAA